MRPNEKTPSRSNLCEARQRLGVEPVRRVFELVVHPLATPETPGAFYKGYRLMGIDGTVMDVPDSPANEERFGRSSGGRGDAAFPQIRKLSLVELGTHVETALAIGGYHDSEQKLVVQLFDKIPDDALLLEDRNFFSYDHWKELDSRGVKLLVRIKSTMILKPIERLPDGSCLAKIYPSSYDRDKDRKGIVVRVIEYTLDDPLRTGHGETHRLLTKLLDHMMFPAMELICLYHERWEEEQVYDEQKTHQDPRRPTKPAHFRSQTPERWTGDLRTVAGPLRRACADAGGRKAGEPGRGQVVIHGLFPDPARAAARVPEFHADRTRAVVSFAVGGNGPGAHRAAPQ